MKKAIFTGLLSVMVAAPALAENEDGWYLGGGIGSASSSGSGIASSSSMSGFGAYGYKFNKNFALGVDSAIFSVDNDNLTYSFGALVATGFIPLNDKFTLLGKFGYGVSMNIATSTALGSIANLTATHAASTFGAGVEYNLNENWRLRAVYDSYEVDASGWFAAANTVPVSNLSAAVFYQF